MKYNLTIISGLLFLACFSFGNDLNGKIEFVSKSEKCSHEGGFIPLQSVKNKFEPDTSIGPISLNNSKNVSEYLGRNVMERLNDTAMMPHSSVLSKDSEQRFTFYFHPGGVKNKFSEFQVNFTEKIKRNDKIVADKEFETESGIKLGITKNELKLIKGKPDSITKKKRIVYHYRIDDYEHSEFLQKYNMPIYYADYEFGKGKLIEFRFGFEYP